MSKNITIPRLEILDLIACAEDYGFADDVLFAAFSNWLISISNSDIETYLVEYIPLDTYSKEDADNIREKFKSFNKRYCK